jgi:hypothetical protein
VIVATPASFKEAWCEHFRGREVRACYDNGKGGWQHAARVAKLLGESGVAEEVRVLKWPDGTPDGYDLNDLVRGRSHLRAVGLIQQNSYKVTAQPKLAWELGWERKPGAEQAIEWIWPDHRRCGTYASDSGVKATLKSTLMREVVARYTEGEAMPNCGEVGRPAGHMNWISAKDSVKTAWARLEATSSSSSTGSPTRRSKTIRPSPRAWKTAAGLPAESSGEKQAPRRRRRASRCSSRWTSTRTSRRTSARARGRASDYI